MNTDSWVAVVLIALNSTAALAGPEGKDGPCSIFVKSDECMAEKGKAKWACAKTQAEKDLKDGPACLSAMKHNHPMNEKQ